MKTADIALRRATPADATLLAALNAHVHDPHVRAEPELYRETDLFELSAHA